MTVNIHQRDSLARMEYLTSSEILQESARRTSTTTDAPALPEEVDEYDKVEIEKDEPKASESLGLSTDGTFKSSMSDDSAIEKRATRGIELIEFTTKLLYGFTVHYKDKLETARGVESGITELNEQIFGKLHGLVPLSPDMEDEWNWKLEVFLEILFSELASKRSSGTELLVDVDKHLQLLKQLDEEIIRAMDVFRILEGKARFGETVRVKEGGLSSEVVEALVETQTQIMRFLHHTNSVNHDVLKVMKVPQEFIDTLPKHAKKLFEDDSLYDDLKKWPARNFSIVKYMQEETKDDLASAEIMLSKLEKACLIWDGKLQSQSRLSQVRRSISTKHNNSLLTGSIGCMFAIHKVKQAFPQMSHTELDKRKIDGCTDTLLAGLEAYSRALKSRCVILLSRIGKVLTANKLELGIEVRDNCFYFKSAPHAY